MEYEQLEDFFDVLSDRSAGMMTTLSLMAVCAGLFLGYLFGALFGLSGVFAVLIPALCAGLAYILTYDYQGVLVAARISLAVHYARTRTHLVGTTEASDLVHDYTDVVILEDDPLVRRV